jgi:uncharacterized protein
MMVFPPLIATRITMPTDKFEDLIRYDMLVQEALIGVVRRVLTDVMRDGLPGEHHFYITFRTDAPGVKLSTRLREKYPDEMNIVLQHRFWDLLVSEKQFEVGLSFAEIPEKLVVPFDALTGFFDPSVQFGLKFSADENAAANDGPDREEPAKPSLRTVPLVKRNEDPDPSTQKPGKKTRLKSERKQDAAEASLIEDGAGAQAPEAAEAPPPPAEAKPDQGKGAEIVSIDAFRKKKT